MLYDLSLNPTILFDFVSILEQQGHKQLNKHLKQKGRVAWCTVLEKKQLIVMFWVCVFWGQQYLKFALHLMIS